jgi:uncharacterized membrane protein
MILVIDNGMGRALVLPVVLLKKLDMKRVTKSLVLLLLPVVVLAHSGHGHFTADYLQHYLSSPEQSLPILLGLVLVVLLGLVIRYELAVRAARNKDRDA